MRYAASLVLGLVLLVAASSQPPFPPPLPFTITITYPGVLQTVGNPVIVSGISGAPNSTVTVKLYDSTFNVVATKIVGTDGAGNWAADFGIRPAGQYATDAFLPTGQGDANIFFVSVP